jgi:hypothetical protein
MPKKGSLAARIREEQGPEPGDTAPAAPKQPSRVGKKQITVVVSPEMHKAMRMLSLDTEKSTTALVIEAMDDLLRKHGKSPIGG